MLTMTGPRDHPVLARRGGPGPTDCLPAAIVVCGDAVRLAIYRRESPGVIRVVSVARRTLQLQRPVEPGSGTPGPDAVELVAALSDFRAICDRAGVTSIRAVAASAFRTDPDACAVIQQAGSATRVPIELLTGRREAILAYRGAIHSLPVASGLAVHLGGGTLGIVEFDDRRVRQTWSLPFGARAVADRHFLSDPPAASEVRELAESLTTALARLAVPGVHGGDVLVGAGCSVRALARMDRRLRGRQPAGAHGYPMDAAGVRSAARRLVAASGEERRGNSDADSGPAASLAGGAVVLAALMSHLGAAGLTVSVHGILDGLILDSPGGLLLPGAVADRQTGRVTAGQAPECSGLPRFNAFQAIP